MGIPEVVVGGTAVADTAVAAWNAYQQWQNNKYLKEVQEETWSREDNAVQRRVEDLKAAGLSPVLAAGQGAEAGAVIKTEAPEIKLSPEAIARDAMSLLKMKADISKTEAETRVMNVSANIAEETQSQMIVKALNEARIVAEHASQERINSAWANQLKEIEYSLFGQQLQNISSIIREREYNKAQSVRMQVRTTDHDRYLQYLLSGSGILSDLAAKINGGRNYEVR